MKLFKIHITRECSMTSGHCDQWFAAWQFLKKWLVVEDVLTIKEGVMDERTTDVPSFFTLIRWTVSLEYKGATGSCPGPFMSWLYPLNPRCEWCDVWRLTTTPGSTPPTLFEQWCGFFYVPQEPGKCKCCETGPMIFPVKLKDKFNLTSKNHFSRNKNQQYYPRFDHSINQTRKQLWFIAERKKKPTI